ncbi:MULTISPECIES: hypothetical protein [unclassified Nocardiopsis]|uniref:hypothetical protein n=1 Tax=unclassified Nocardiopsis TaxID=2649073 RepID=UPI00135853A7|nr:MULTISPECIES: hypothetical protein [unclassified Nocardiopsis]
MTDRPVWDDDRQRWRRPPEQPLSEAEETRPPLGAAVGITAVALALGTASAATAQTGDQLPPLADAPAGSETWEADPADGGEWSSDEEDFSRVPDPEEPGEGAREEAGARETVGGGSGADGRGGDGGSSETDSPDEPPASAPEGEEEPTEEPSPTEPDLGDASPEVVGFTFLAEDDSWELAEEKEEEWVFTRVDDDRFRVVVLWTPGGDEALSDLLEERVRVPARAEEGFEEVFAAPEEEWRQREPAFEYRSGTDPVEHVLATAFSEGATAFAVISRGPAEEGREAVEENLDGAVASFRGGEEGAH